MKTHTFGDKHSIPPIQLDTWLGIWQCQALCGNIFFSLGQGHLDTLLGSEDTSLEKVSIPCIESWGYNVGVEGLHSMHEALGSLPITVNTHTTPAYHIETTPHHRLCGVCQQLCQQICLWSIDGYIWSCIFP